MSIADDWALAYARQADADFRAWQRYEDDPRALAAECHKLLFLQMACEKLCKAHLVRAGVHSPADVQTSHGFVRKHLPAILKQEVVYARERPRNLKWTLSQIQHLSGEIEILNPAMTRDGRRPDNCEYPWEDGGKVYSPLDHDFFPARLLTAPAGRIFLNLLRRAIVRNL